MENDTWKVRRFLESVIAAGAARAIRFFDPKADRMTQREAYDFFQDGRHGEGWIKRMVREGKVTTHKGGKAVNSPTYYSKAELLQAKAIDEAVREEAFKDTNL